MGSLLSLFNLAQSVASFKRHQVVDRLRQEDLHIIVFAQVFNTLDYSHMRGKVASISLALRADSTLDSVALVNTDS